MDGYTSVFAARDQDLAVLGVAQLSDWLVELNEFVSDAGFLDIEYTHGTRLEST